MKEKDPHFKGTKVEADIGVPIKEIHAELDELLKVTQSLCIDTSEQREIHSFPECSTTPVKIVTKINGTGNATRALRNAQGFPLRHKKIERQPLPSRVHPPKTRGHFRENIAFPNGPSDVPGFPDPHGGKGGNKK